MPVGLDMLGGGKGPERGVKLLGGGAIPWLPDENDGGIMPEPVLMGGLWLKDDCCICCWLESDCGAGGGDSEGMLIALADCKGCCLGISGGLMVKLRSVRSAAGFGSGVVAGSGAASCSLTRSAIASRPVAIFSF